MSLVKAQVKDFMTSKRTLVRSDDSICETIRKVSEDTETTITCVLDDQNRLIGVITPKELLRTIELSEFHTNRYAFYEGSEVLRFLEARTAGDIMRGPVSVKREDAITDAVNIMLNMGVYEVPVVDEDDRVVGEVNLFTILRKIE